MRERLPRGENLSVVQVPGKQQFGLFAGLQANKGGIGAHISRTAVHHLATSTHDIWRLSQRR